MNNLQFALDWNSRTPLTILLGILAGIAIVLLGRWLAGVVANYVSRSLERAHVDATVVRFTRTLTYVGLLIAVIITALRAVGIQTTSFTALLAAAGLAVGLALQGSLSNFASGVMILLFRPYVVGDYVEAAGTGGTVEEVSLFNTILRTPDNVKVIAPNSTMSGGIVKNYSANRWRRVDLVTAIGYQDNIGTARDILIEIARSHPLVLPDPPPGVEVLDLADNKVILAVRPWVLSEDYAQVRSDLLEQIKGRFDEAGLGLPRAKK